MTAPYWPSGNTEPRPARPGDTRRQLERKPNGPVFRAASDPPCRTCGSPRPPKLDFCGRCGAERETATDTDLASLHAAFDVRAPWWHRCTAVVLDYLGFGPAPDPSYEPIGELADAATPPTADEAKPADADGNQLQRPTRPERPPPPSPADAMLAGVSRPNAGREAARWFTTNALVALACVVALLVFVRYRLYQPVLSQASEILADAGIHPEWNDKRIPVAEIRCDRRVPGRSARFAVDGLATTYWAYDTRPVPTGTLTNCDENSGKPEKPDRPPLLIVALDVPHDTQPNRLGFAIGIQNGDAPYNANPRPEDVDVIHHQCRNETWMTTVYRLRLADTSEFRRYDLGEPLDQEPDGSCDEASTKPTLYLYFSPSEVHQAVRAKSGSTSPSGPTSAHGWLAVTDLVPYQRR